MTSRIDHTEEIVTKQQVWVVDCDNCGATRPSRGNHDWYELRWPWLDEHTYWYDGCDDGPWDFCTLTCMTGFIGRHTDALKATGGRFRNDNDPASL